MKAGAYSIEDIGAAIIDHVSRRKEDWTPRQLEGMRKFKYNGSWNLAQPENLPDLLKFFDIFNDVFFNGILAGACKVEWYDSTAAGTKGEARAFCQDYLPRKTRDPRFDFEKPWAQIGIKKVDEVNEKWYFRWSPADRLDRYLGSLAHEMLHAAFVIYACNCDHGCKQKFDEAWITHQGHDNSFLAALYAIEKAEKVDRDAGYLGLLGLNLTLHRSRAVTLKVQAGVNLPPDSELRRLGLDIKEVLGDLEALRWDNAWEVKAKRRERQLLKANRCITGSWDVEREEYRCSDSVMATMIL